MALDVHDEHEACMWHAKEAHDHIAHDTTSENAFMGGEQLLMALNMLHMWYNWLWQLGVGHALQLNTDCINAAAVMCRHAREVQAKQNSKSVQQRASEAKKYGYEGMPRVAMPWRIAGQYLRLLKVLRPLLQQPKASRQLGSLQHPLLSAALIAQQQSAAMQRRNRGPGVGLAAVAAAVAEFQGLAL